MTAAVIPARAGGAGSSQDLMRAMMRAARSLASSAVIAPCRPMVRRRERPSPRLCTTKVLVPEG